MLPGLRMSDFFDQGLGEDTFGQGSQLWEAWSDLEVRVWGPNFLRQRSFRDSEGSLPEEMMLLIKWPTSKV